MSNDEKTAKRTISPRRLVLTRAGLLAIVLACAAHVAEAQEPPPEASLRSAFLGGHQETGQLVGRLGVRLVDGKYSRQVGLDHVFRSGNQLRFEVTSSVRGRLYVLYRPRDGEAQILWPLAGTESVVEPWAPSAVPPSPHGLELDEEVGEEHFYVAIRSTPDGQSIAEGEARRDVQDAVRALDEPGRRGVFFDPGPQDDDLHVYFAPSEKNGTLAVVEFQLRHE